MDVSGSGITPFSARIRDGFRPQTKLAFKWRQLSSGNWSGLDRGSSSDIYEASFSMRRTESEINTFIDEVEANRAAGSNVITLGGFLATEYIFGVNVDHSGSITATILDVSDRMQHSWKGWGVNVRVRATSVSFTGSSSLPTLAYCEHGVKASSDRNINKFDTYTGTYAYQDHDSDSGVFEGVFTLTTANMILLRNYIKNQRTGDFAIADTFGVDYPFGPRSSNSYPFTTKLIGWEDLGHWGVKWHKIRLRFAEVVS